MRYLFAFLWFGIWFGAQGVKLYTIECLYPYTPILKVNAAGYWVEGIYILCFESVSPTGEKVYFALPSKCTTESENEYKALKFRTILGKTGELFGDEAPLIFTAPLERGAEIWATTNYIAKVPYDFFETFVKTHKDIIRFEDQYGPLTVIDYDAVRNLPPQKVLGAYSGAFARYQFDTVLGLDKHPEAYREVSFDLDGLLYVFALLLECELRRKAHDMFAKGSVCYDDYMLRVDGQERFLNFLEISEFLEGLPQALRDFCDKYKTKFRFGDGSAQDFCLHFVSLFKSHFAQCSCRLLENTRSFDDFYLMVTKHVSDLQGVQYHVSNEGELVDRRPGAFESDHRDRFCEVVFKFPLKLMAADLKDDGSESAD